MCHVQPPPQLMQPLRGSPPGPPAHQQRLRDQHTAQHRGGQQVQPAHTLRRVEPVPGREQLSALPGCAQGQQAHGWHGSGGGRPVHPSVQQTEFYGEGREGTSPRGLLSARGGRSHPGTWRVEGRALGAGAGGLGG